MLEFFGNNPFTQAPERAISQADQLLDYKIWAEEDRKMFSQLRMREDKHYWLMIMPWNKLKNKV
mgnify:FL=1